MFDAFGGGGRLFGDGVDDFSVSALHFRTLILVVVFAASVRHFVVGVDETGRQKLGERVARRARHRTNDRRVDDQLRMFLRDSAQKFRNSVPHSSDGMIQSVKRKVRKLYEVVKLNNTYLIL
jgi:hypothetical protein